MPGQFQPQQGRDLFGENVSLMSRIDANARANQQEADRQAQFEILKPVAIAQAHAEIVTAGASIANATRMQQLRTQAAQDSVPFNDEFTDASQLADFDAQARALSALQGKVAYMAILPEYKGFVDAVNNGRAQAHASALANMHAEAQLEAAKIGAEQRASTAQGAADSRLAVAQTNVAGKVDAANIAADSREAVASTTAAGRLQQAKVRAERQFELETAIEHRDDAIRDGNRERAQIYQDHINKLNSFAADPKTNPLPATAPVKKSEPDTSSMSITVPGITKTSAEPSSATASKSPAAKNGVIHVEGKDYPVFRDAKGVRAYLKDGKYIKISE